MNETVSDDLIELRVVASRSYSIRWIRFRSGNARHGERFGESLLRAGRRAKRAPGYPVTVKSGGIWMD